MLRAGPAEAPGSVRAEDVWQHASKPEAVADVGLAAFDRRDWLGADQQALVHLAN